MDLEKLREIAIIENYNEFLDRLICSNFHFKMDFEEQKMYVYSYPWKEETDNDIGFHYYGYKTAYYYVVETIEDLQEIITDAVNRMKDYIKKEVVNKLQNIIKEYSEEE